MTSTGDVTCVRRRGSVAVIDLVGDVNASAEQSVRAAWDEATAQRPEAVVLSFQDAGYINSTGIALIVEMLAAARARKIPLRAYGLTPHYREIFEITRLADFMIIDADEDGAVTGIERSTT
jgi:anti-anti-sigma factor